MPRIRPAKQKTRPATAPLPPLWRSFPWLPAVGLFLLVVIVYIPSMTNGFIWDDPQYVVDNPTLKSADGLWQIWTDPTSLPQYYPMVHTTFWIEARLWRTDTAPGYHVDNILLHALAAVLLWRALALLKIPWPLLVAAIFALHPVMVESVAWVTERKNVLSLVFYLLAFHAYFQSGLLDIPEAAGVHPRPHPRAWYIASLVLFLLALFSKTVTCSLPAAMLLIVWWKRGSLRWRDVRPLLPMFFLGLILSQVTSYLEHTQVGAAGPDFNWSPVDRLLIAGHALCFYAVKLLWPHPLIFMYPKWNLHLDRGWQFIYPAIAGAVLLGLWIARRWIGRGPLTAMLFFAGTLVPALGFVNVYPMRYSFVADHFQYLASIGVIVLIVACLERIVRSSGVPQLWLRALVAIVILAPLAWLTWQQQGIYQSPKTLWENTIAQNPNCWMAHVNLASAFKEEKNYTAALAETKRGLQLAPNEADTNYDYGVALALQEKWPQATQQFQRAIACDPKCAPAWSYLARVLWEHGGDTPESQTRALEAAQRALLIRPTMGDAHYVLARVDEFQNDLPAAISEYNKVLAVNDKDFHAHYNLGNCLLATDRPGEAAGEYLQVLNHDSRDAAAWTNLGVAYRKVGRVSDAITCFDRALSINPNLRPARGNLAAMGRGR
jgi:tetratricopeptide (TPR) repeat protein